MDEEKKDVREEPVQPDPSASPSPVPSTEPPVSPSPAEPQEGGSEGEAAPQQ